MLPIYSCCDNKMTILFKHKSVSPYIFFFSLSSTGHVIGVILHLKKELYLISLPYIKYSTELENKNKSKGLKNFASTKSLSFSYNCPIFF